MRTQILGLPLDLVNLEQAITRIGELMQTPGTHQVVTLNPEAVVRCQTDPALAKAIREAELVTADGVGIVWAAGQLTPHKLEGRVTGADLIPGLLGRFGPKLTVYFLGAKPGIAQQAAENARRQWGIQIAGVQDGYFKDEAPIVKAIQKTKADLLLVGMGEQQDSFIHRNKTQLGVKVAIGIGGMLDVLSGEVKRVPQWAQKLKIEWLLRVGLDRKRWGRFPRLIRFIQLVRQARRKA